MAACDGAQGAIVECVLLHYKEPGMRLGATLHLVRQWRACPRRPKDDKSEKRMVRGG